MFSIFWHIIMQLELDDDIIGLTAHQHQKGHTRQV